MSRRRSTSDASAPAEGRSRSSSDASDALGTSPAQGPLPGVMVRKNPTQREPVRALDGCKDLRIPFGLFDVHVLYTTRNCNLGVSLFIFSRTLTSTHALTL